MNWFLLTIKHSGKNKQGVRTTKILAEQSQIISAQFLRRSHHNHYIKHNQCTRHMHVSLNTFCMRELQNEQTALTSYLLFPSQQKTITTTLLICNSWFVSPLLLQVPILMQNLLMRGSWLLCLIIDVLREFLLFTYVTKYNGQIQLILLFSQDLTRKLFSSNCKE